MHAVELTRITPTVAIWFSTVIESRSNCHTRLLPPSATSINRCALSGEKAMSNVTPEPSVRGAICTPL